MIRPNRRLSVTQGPATVASGTWNGAGQLTAYTDPAAAMSGAAYDGSGLRASATFTPAGGSAATRNFVWDTTPTVPQLLMDSANAYIYAGPGAPAEQVSLATGTVTYLSADALGSVRGTVNSSGTLAGTTSYDAYGNPQTAGGLTATTPFGYGGGYTDPTGLIYLIHRYYDPATGQFTSVDPDLAATLQPYAYAGGNPVDTTDPAGLCPQLDCGGVPQPGNPGHRIIQPIYHPCGTPGGAACWTPPPLRPPPRPHPAHRRPAKARVSLNRAASRKQILKTPVGWRGAGTLKTPIFLRGPADILITPSGGQER